jgi:hypothetical protein
MPAIAPMGRSYGIGQWEVLTSLIFTIGQAASPDHPK